MIPELLEKLKELIRPISEAPKGEGIESLLIFDDGRCEKCYWDSFFEPGEKCWVESLSGILIENLQNYNHTYEPVAFIELPSKRQFKKIVNKAYYEIN